MKHARVPRDEAYEKRNAVYVKILFIILKQAKEDQFYILRRICKRIYEKRVKSLKLREDFTQLSSYGLIKGTFVISILE